MYHIYLFIQNKTKFQTMILHIKCKKKSDFLSSLSKIIGYNLYTAELSINNIYSYFPKKRVKTHIHNLYHSEYNDFLPLEKYHF